MKCRQRGVLFVSHEATRTGAPTELLHFLRWFKKNGNRPFSILMARGGELVPAFEELAPAWVLDSSPWCPGGTRTVILTAMGLRNWARRREQADAQKLVASYSPGLVYVNSIASAGSLDVLAPTVPVLTHVHELEFMFRSLASPALRRLLTETTHFIACSEAVRENLIGNRQVPAERVDVVHESIPVRQIRPDRTRADIFRELNVPDDGQLVVGSGTLGWTKGSDIFVLLAQTICRERAKVYFAWVGGGSAVDVARFEHDIRALGLTEKMRAVGAVAQPADYLAAADVFVLTSRHDSYPLVCLEAAALGKPIVCFADAGGMPEFVEQDSGFVVPYLDLREMSQRVVSLLDSLECRQIMGAAAQQKVTRRHDTGMAAPRIMEIIERTIAGG
jgi:glycosyltransferase involved in cell wall biosynthesis